MPILPLLVLTSVFFLSVPVMLELEDLNTISDEKYAREVIENAKEAKRYSDLYFDEQGGGTSSLLSKGVKPSELVVYDDEFTLDDGLNLNKYDVALQKYLKTNPEGIPTCTDLVAIGGITLEECNSLESKEVSFYNVSDKGVSFTVRGERGKRVATILNKEEPTSNSVTVTTAVAESSKKREKKKLLFKKAKTKFNNYLEADEYTSAAIQATKMIRYISPRKGVILLNEVAFKAKAYENSGELLDENFKEFLAQGVVRVVQKDSNITLLSANTKGYVADLTSEELDEISMAVTKEFLISSDTELINQEANSLLQSVQNKIN